MATARPSFADTLSKTRARLKTRGAGEVVGTITGNARGRIRSHEEILFLTRSARWDGEVARKSEEPLGFAEATPADGRDYERFIGTDSARTFSKRLTRDTRCWLVRGRGMILHATWTTTGAAWTSEMGRFFVPPARSAYIYESFTRSEARGLGIYPFALVEIGKALAREGIDTLYVGVEVENTPSVRAITKAGFQPAFSVPFGRTLGKVTIEPATGPRADLAEQVLRAE